MAGRKNLEAMIVDVIERNLHNKTSNDGIFNFFWVSKMATMNPAMQSVRQSPRNLVFCRCSGISFQTDPSIVRLNSGAELMPR